MVIRGRDLLLYHLDTVFDDDATVVVAHALAVEVVCTLLGGGLGSCLHLAYASDVETCSVATVVALYPNSREDVAVGYLSEAYTCSRSNVDGIEAGVVLAVGFPIAVGKRGVRATVADALAAVEVAVPVHNVGIALGEAGTLAACL